MNFQHCKGKSNSLNVRTYNSNYLIPLCKTELFKWNFLFFLIFFLNETFNIISPLIPTSTWAGQFFCAYAKQCIFNMLIHVNKPETKGTT